LLASKLLVKVGALPTLRRLNGSQSTVYLKPL
jgi:hypothetical protein